MLEGRKNWTLLLEGGVLEELLLALIVAILDVVVAGRMTHSCYFR